MVSAVSSSTTTPTTSVLSTADSKTTAAQLKAELADKQAELAQAKTDDEKSQINAQISELQAQISAAQTDSDSSSSSSASSAAANAQKGEARHKGHFNTADKAAPESRMSSANMDVLMRMGSKGGMGGAQHITKMYTDMDTDGDGKVTKDEFVSANSERMGEDRASKLYASIDTDNTGSITEDQFANSLTEQDHHEGGPRMGPPQGGMPMWGSQAGAPTGDQSPTNA